MRSLDNVSVLRDSVGEVAIDLRKAAETDAAVDVAVVTRDVDGQLDVRWSPQTPAQIVEMGAWLFTLAQHEMLKSHKVPEVESECFDEEP